MTVHRFFISDPVIQDGNMLLPEDTARQIKNVLRLKIGNVIEVFDNSGNEYQISLTQIEKKEILGHIDRRYKNTSEPSINIILYQALLPKDSFEEVLEKGTEVGINEFVPLETDRSIVKTKDIKSEKIQRWKKIIQEAAEQSERGKVPHISYPIKFSVALQEAVKKGNVLIAFENEDNFFPSMLPRIVEKATTIALFIGPEGGFTKGEMQKVKENKIKTISLGPRIFKSEIAGIILSSLILFSIKDFDHKRKSESI
jgi:16S rRNA (uracil1498-N3)-methyltransferase